MKLRVPRWCLPTSVRDKLWLILKKIVLVPCELPPTLKGIGRFAWLSHGKPRMRRSSIQSQVRQFVFGVNTLGENDSRRPAAQALAWIRCGSRTLSVAREQLRPAYGYEHWSPDRKAWQELRAAQIDLANHTEETPAPEAGLPADDFPPEGLLPDKLRDIPVPLLEAASIRSAASVSSS